MRRYAVIFAFLTFWMAAGCSDDKPNELKSVQTRSAAAPVRTAPAKAEEVITVEPELENPKFVYDERGKRDPFTSLLAIKDPVADDAEPLTPLQKFGLKEIRLIAIVIGKDEPRAMVEAPDNKAYTLTPGVKIGRNKGVVQAITPNAIIIEERFRDFSGTTRTETKRIALPQGEGE
ncbi:MAG: pilus assembly protein PilP [Desulfuromonadaceae bacterium]|nr:pilus assembly protein PilP [Desulfuromonadaceae bacterium]